MRHTFTAIAMILILTIPVLCQGSIGPMHRLELAELETAGWDAYRFSLEREWQLDTSGGDSLDLAPVVGEKNILGGSLNDIHGGIPHSNMPAPRDMVSMMSFVWAEMFGGVDIVAEVRDFARKIKRKGRPVTVKSKGQSVKASRKAGRDLRNRWSFIVACRVDGQTEVAALFKNRGRLFGEGTVAFEINALDPLSEEIGLKIAYNNGDFNFRADRMTLTETAAAKLEFKF